MANSKGSGQSKKLERPVLHKCGYCSFETRKEEALTEHLSSVHVLRDKAGRPKLDRFKMPIRDQIVTPVIKES